MPLRCICLVWTWLPAAVFCQSQLRYVNNASIMQHSFNSCSLNSYLVSDARYELKHISVPSEFTNPGTVCLQCGWPRFSSGTNRLNQLSCSFNLPTLSVWSTLTAEMPNFIIKCASEVGGGVRRVFDLLRAVQNQMSQTGACGAK
jgi:hypothetical protein